MNLFQIIKNKVDLWTIVSRYVAIKRAGGYWKGPCPFHSETDASFTISPEKRIFYCFGCHQSGDVLDFFCKIENVQPVDGALALAQEFGIEIPESVFDQAQANTNSKDSIINACKVFSDWTASSLEKNPIVLKYLKDRKVTKESIERFKIGYFPGEGNKQTFVNFALENNILLQDLIAAGIFVSQGNDIWSPFFDRVIFPIRNWQGKTVAFGARVLPDSDAKPKYYNSRESQVFHKGESFFGIDLARPNIKKSNFCIIVEGYFDCVLMHQNGFSETLATLGTAFGPSHFKALSQLSGKVFLIYDGDKAGLAAMLKVARASFEHDIELLVLTLPENEDPASCVTKGIEINLSSATGIFRFFAQSIAQDFYKKNIGERLLLVKELVETLKNVSDKAKKEILILEASCQLQIPTSSLRSEVLKEQAFPARSTSASEQPTARVNDSIALQLFCIFLNAHKNNNKDVLLPQNLKELLETSCETQALDLLNKFLQSCSFNCSGECVLVFIANLPLELQNFICKCMMKYDGKNGLESFDRLVERIKTDSFKKNIDQLKNKISSGDTDPFAVLKEVVKKVQKFKN